MRDRVNAERTALQMMDDGYSPADVERMRSSKLDVRRRRMPGPTGCAIADAKLREVPGSFAIQNGRHR